MTEQKEKAEEEEEECEPMKIQILNEDDTTLKFVIDGIKDYEINALRRYLIREIPKLAIDTVEFHLGSIRSEEDGTEYESITPLFDEVLAHRISLVPIPTDPEKFNFRKECTCNGAGCPSCTVIYTLNVKSNKKDEMVTVYSGDLKPVGDPSMQIADKKIPLVKLAYKQGILLYATAELGRAKNHAKWQVVNVAGYSEYPEIRIDNKKCMDACEKCIDVCPPRILVKKGNNLTVTDESKCILCNMCVKRCPDGAVEVRGNKEKYIFQLETDGSMSARKALLYSLQSLKEEFNQIGKFASELKD
ncbi:MAG: DNA-directed RNA polymerase subunit D [Candidatus Thermoplasmatota archaeon]|jgi:DNA-directed RNA polymerase subunit D|nr:DNA-directed RNA polymerase subunit D [Candidatus Thermoplasmatota archaeon]MCL5963765.1 DNA-directed RNA polymerase subunit D [Candidatus Thermoplasmatota archaeon]